MRLWRSQKIVEAEPITSYDDSGFRKFVTTGEGVTTWRHEAPGNFFARGRPRIGDYLVRYADGYMSWIPKRAFEEGYTLVEPGALELGAAVRRGGLEDAP
jgi:hypothetical protein